jgi:hypothetical protein
VILWISVRTSRFVNLTESNRALHLAKGKNQNKSDKPPAQFFADVSESEMRRALIDRDMLDYGRFSRFLKDRSGKIVGTVKKLCSAKIQSGC